MKKRFRAWHQPLLTFYSKSLYIDISNRWKGTNLGYLCILIAICLLPATYRIGSETSGFIDRAASIYLMQIPPMRITAGRLSVDAPQPYSIIEGDRTLLLIDTSGKIRTLEEAGSDALLTKSQLLIGQQNKDPMVYDLSAINDMEINQEIVAGFINQFKPFLLPAYYGITLLFTIIIFLLAALLSGAIALLFGWVQQKKLNYATGLRLSVAALTPPLVLSTLLQGTGHRVPPILYVLLTLAYLYMAVSTCRGANTNSLYINDQPVAR